MRKRVYIETTIPSFYYEIRSTPDMVARHAWTRDWWDNQSFHYDLVTSAAVIEELSQGSYPSKEQALALISHVPLLLTVAAIDAIVETYSAHYVMPRNSLGDALHLALVSRMSFSLNVELYALGERQQIRAHSTCQHALGALRPPYHHACGITQLGRSIR